MSTSTIPSPDEAPALVASGVWVSDADRTVLEPTTLTLQPGELVAAYGEPGLRHTLLTLTLGGRLLPSGGVVGLGQEYAPEALQRAVALVDVPGVSDPDGVSSLTTIVAEELAMAGKPAGRDHVDHWLTSNGLRPHRDERLDDLPPGLRTVALARLASVRPGVRFLALTMPERNGSDPAGWLEDAVALADQGFGVLVTISAGLAGPVAAAYPHVRTVAFGNAEFHDPGLDLVTTAEDHR